MSSSSNSSQAQPQDLYNPNARYIAVVGSVGAGKSTFIQRYVGDACRVPTSDQIRSHTKEVTLYRIILDHDETVLMDTPGFDDHEISDAECVDSLAFHLYALQKAGIRLTGIIYLHNITENRLHAHDIKQLGLLRDLVGQENFGSIWLVTNFWADAARQPELETENRRKYERLREDEEFRLMLDQGATLEKHRNTEESARRIIDDIVDRGRMTELQILRELIQQRKKLADTTVGLELISKWKRADPKTLKDKKRELRALGGLNEMKQRHFEKSRKTEQIAAAGTVAGGTAAVLTAVTAAHAHLVIPATVIVVKVVVVAAATATLCNMM